MFEVIGNYLPGLAVQPSLCLQMLSPDRIRVQRAQVADDDAGEPIARAYEGAYARPIYEAPRDQIETRLAEIWGELLDGQPIGRNDDVFALGGHSLSAMRVANRVQSLLGVELPLSTFFAHTTVAKLSQAILEILALRRYRPLRPIALPPRKGDLLSFSYAQQRLWVLSQLGGAINRHVSVALRLTGWFDARTLRHSANHIFSRHEGLRSVIVLTGGQPRVHLLPPDAGIPWVEHDLRFLSDRQFELQRLEHEIDTPFDLARGPLIRVRLVRLAETEHVLIVTQHQIVSDEWSMEVFLRELSALYCAFIHDKPDPLPPLAIQCADYGALQHEWFSSGPPSDHGEYWRQNLANAPVLLAVPADRQRPSRQSHSGATIPICIDAELTRKLKRLVRQNRTSLSICTLTAWAAVLGRLAGQENVIIGVPVANRGRSEIEDIIGLFVNTLPVRIDLSGQASITEVLGRVRNAMLGALDHADSRFEEVIQSAGLPRQPDHTPLFQVTFAWQPHRGESFRLPGLTTESIQLPSKTVGFDLELSLGEVDGVIRGAVGYSTALFDASTIERHRGYFLGFLGQMVANANQPVMSVEILESKERELLLDIWNQTETAYPEHICLHELFEEQVRKAPESTAVVLEGQSLTYAELDRQANHLAHHLISVGVKSGSTVAICADRSFAMVAGLLGILKAGAAYVPLDLDYPTQRWAYMLEDSNPVLVVADAAGRRNLSEFRGRLPVVDLETAIKGPSQVASNPEPDGITSSCVACVLYTSGSTGIPKGVMVPHRAVCSRLITLRSRYGFSTQDRVLQFAPISFDGSLEDIFCPLISGSTIVLTTDAWLAGPAAFWNQCEEYRITVLDLPCRFWQELSESTASIIPDRVRLVIIGGEAVSRHAIDVWYRRSGHLPPVLNVYGPTETTIIATIQELSPAVPWNSIGRPIANTRIYLLDGSRQPVPLGAVGEIYIGGSGVALGYMNKPALTAERFLDDPFSPVSGGRMYRTGDLARYLPNGNLEFLGRNDQQIKIRGFRIEPGEIETRLNHHPLIRQAAVVDHEATSGDKRLVAYITLTETAPEDFVVELRAHLRSVLPEYMIPSAFVPLDSLPLNPSGKLDRNRLPAPDREAFPKQLYEPPRGSIETRLANIWTELLGLERVGRHDDFFDLGGHSLLAVRLISQVRSSMATDVSLHQFFRHSTISSFAPCILAGQKGDRSLIRPQKAIDSGPPADLGPDERFPSVRLPFELHVPLRSYLSSAYPLGILWSQSSFQQCFLHFNINLEFCVPRQGFDGIPAPHPLLYPTPRNGLAHWRELGFVDFEVFDSEFLEGCTDSNLLDFLLKKVQEGNYILIYSDEFYLPFRESTHYRHEALIVGYSETTRSFLFAAYDAAGEYGIATSTFDTVARALKSRDIADRPFLLTISPKSKVPEAQIALDLIRQEIDDYLNARPSSTQHPWLDLSEDWRSVPPDTELVFGVACYDEVAKYLTLHADCAGIIDPRCTRLLWEHKKVMALRIRFLADLLTNHYLKGLEPAYRQVENTARRIHHLSCLNRLGEHGTDRIESAEIAHLLFLAKSQEREILTEMRDVLSRETSVRYREASFTEEEIATIQGATSGRKLHPLEVILCKRKLGKSLGNEVSRWTCCLVEAGYESREIEQLANLPSNLYPPLLEPSIDRVLRSLGIAEIATSDAVILFCRYLIEEALERRLPSSLLFERLAYLRRSHEGSDVVRELNAVSAGGDFLDPVQRSRMVHDLKELALAYHRITKIETGTFRIGRLFTDLLRERQEELWTADPTDGHTIDVCKNTLLAAEDGTAAWHCCEHWQRKLSNKLNAKAFATKLGVKVARLYWQGNTAEAIPFGELPHSYVLKATTGMASRQVLPIVDGFDVFAGRSVTANDICKAVSEILAEGRKANGGIEDERYNDGIVFIEEFLRDRNGSSPPSDYKCYCFAGRIAYIQVIGSDTRQVWYTSDWRVVDDAMLAVFNRGVPTAAPDNLDDIIETAETLSAAYEYPFVRLDLYNTTDGVYFGEFTHHPSAQLMKELWTPHANEIMGRLWFNALAP